MTFKDFLQLLKIKKAIKKAKSIAFFTHQNPDLDGLGSTFALAKACENNGKKVSIYINDTLTSEHKMLLDEKYFYKAFASQSYDLLICMDTSTQHMLGKFYDVFKAHNNTVIIDHHITADRSLANLFFSDITSSSCTQITFELIKMLKYKISQDIATALYAGLSSDTNSFVNDNTNLKSFEDAAELISLGADIVKVNDARYKHRSLANVEIQKTMLNNFEIIDNKIAICVTTLKDLGDKISSTECSSFANYLLSIDGVDIGCSLVEKEPNSYKCSLRSMKGINVNKIAVKLGGGGHKQASGALVTGTAKEVKKFLIETIKQSLKEDKNA